TTPETGTTGGPNVRFPLFGRIAAPEKRMSSRPSPSMSRAREANLLCGSPSETTGSKVPSARPYAISLFPRRSRFPSPSTSCTSTAGIGYSLGANAVRLEQTAKALAEARKRRARRVARMSMVLYHKLAFDAEVAEQHA